MTHLLRAKQVEHAGSALWLPKQRGREVAGSMSAGSRMIGVSVMAGGKVREEVRALGLLGLLEWGPAPSPQARQ